MIIWNSFVYHFQAFLEEALSLLYPECGCCGRRLWDVQRREGEDLGGYSMRDVYGVLCDDCYQDLRND
jgi:hypothetical protein